MLHRCPICGHKHETLVNTFDQEMDEPLTRFLAEEVPGWKGSDGACTRCIDQAGIAIEQEILSRTGKYEVAAGFQILPIGDRLTADPDLTGKGVTICLIDSGFDMHPDLIYPENRILKVLDMSTANPSQTSMQPNGQRWHGTMTSVVCAGDGHLSKGKYKSLAPDAKLVLLRVMNDNGVITSDSIIRAINWAIHHQKNLNIRIINLSVYGDEGIQSDRSPINSAVHRAFQAGIVVVAAAGNDPYAQLNAPANSIDVISVGGLNDENSINPLMNTIYHSSYGSVGDMTRKPDLIAPAVWIPAPILPGTSDHREAEILFKLANSTDAALPAILVNEISHTSMPVDLLKQSVSEVREFVNKRIEEQKLISGHYKHVDGTSFAAPIICSVIAQMIEANPAMDPVTIREILMVTARFLPAVDREKQGWGVVQPKYATQMAAGKTLSPPAGVTPVIDYKNMKVSFFFYQQEATSVGITGDFLQWNTEPVPLTKTAKSKNEWSISVPFQRKGVFKYKFIIDQDKWIADPRNPYRDLDGYNGFNSKLIIQ
ncbi:MAG: S8 family serine peptidase [Saprospiraceae bacterium]|uniref:S8 family serine peptidase n=1 Tax=Candidatus Opimibacter skivensis TaxID=2982028 RepID=A0A9D7T033_9BACT|nr:S8 family serine peptidase [Candidatus Opimibacter skivensis]